MMNWKVYLDHESIVLVKKVTPKDFWEVGHHDSCKNLYAVVREFGIETWDFNPVKCLDLKFICNL